MANDRTPFDDEEILPRETGAVETILAEHGVQWADDPIGTIRGVKHQGVQWLLKKVFDHQAMVERYGERDGAFGGSGDDGARILSALAHDPRMGWRAMLLAADTTVERIDALAAALPHLSCVLNPVQHAVRASHVTGQPVWLPPLLLVGPPGIGKSYLLNRLADALGVTHDALFVPALVGASPFTGTDQSWRKPRPGRPAMALATATHAHVLFCLDEIDKAPSRDFQDISDQLHGVLEPENAKALHDQCLDLPIAVDSYFWVATANRSDHLMPSLLDRFLVIETPAPNVQQMRLIAENIYRACAESWADWFGSVPDQAVLTAISELPPRRARRLIALAMAKAASERRRQLTLADLRSVAPQSLSRPKMGFL
ncbi:MAG: AAA family ATPase [Beijerinckiaceae bacterium]|jgi:ATP-dependent Lon protease|nr:AAA family ATPase [Beijerinckiaceae bacterium]